MGRLFFNRIKVKVYSKYLHISIESLKGAAYFVKLNKTLNFMNNSAMVNFYSKQWAVSSEENYRLVPTAYLTNATTLITARSAITSLT